MFNMKLLDQSDPILDQETQQTDDARLLPKLVLFYHRHQGQRA